jgi:acyl-CoA synthetase (NDP forming)
VSNIGGAGVLAADACTQAGLTVHQPHGQTRSRLRALIPPGGAAGGPIDTTAAISAEAFRECLELAAADEEVSAIIGLVLPTGSTGDLVAAIRQADIRVPLAAVLLDQAETVRLLPGRTNGTPIPAYAYPKAAAAVARAARYGAWRAAPSGVVPEFAGIRTQDAHALVREFLEAGDGGWVPPTRPPDCCTAAACR